jgi:hypothetical protein
MWFLDKLVERRIDEARARGDLDDLAGQGRPLQLEDLSSVPEELRAAYVLLKNAGYLPPEVHTRQRITELEALICQAATPELAAKDRQRLALLKARLGHRMDLDPVYASTAEDRLHLGIKKSDVR